MSLLSVSAHSIDAAGFALEADLPPAWLEAELRDAAVTARLDPPREGQATPGDPACHVSVRLSRSGNDIVVRGRVRAALTTPCARCTEPAAIDVDTELSLLLQPRAPAPKGAPKAPKPKRVQAEEAKHAGGSRKEAKLPGGNGKEKEEEYEFSADEADVDTFDGETVELDPFVREAILLEVPNFPLCSEGCPGIRPAAESAAAEASPRLDPRLAPLGALRGLVQDTPGAPAIRKKK